MTYKYVPSPEILFAEEVLFEEPIIKFPKPWEGKIIWDFNDFTKKMMDGNYP